MQTSNDSKFLFIQDKRIVKYIDSRAEPSGINTFVLGGILYHVGSSRNQKEMIWQCCGMRNTQAVYIDKIS